MPFFKKIFSFFALVVSFSQNSNRLFCVCLSIFCIVLFCVFRLVSSLQKNNLSSCKLVLIRFGYTGFSFLSHAVRLWFVVFKKLRWLVWIII